MVEFVLSLSLDLVVVLVLDPGLGDVVVDVAVGVSVDPGSLTPTTLGGVHPGYPSGKTIVKSNGGRVGVFILFFLSFGFLFGFLLFGFVSRSLPGVPNTNSDNPGKLISSSISSRVDPSGEVVWETLLGYIDCFVQVYRDQTRIWSEDG